MKMCSYETLIYTKSEKVATITLNRPNDANSLNRTMSEELADAAQNIDSDLSIKSVILSGSGKFFCSGGDVKAMSELGNGATKEIKRIADNLHTAISTFARMKSPVIVAVNGIAAGAGFSLAIMGDLVIASESSNFTMAYTKVGLSPDGSSSFYLPRLVGVRKAQELMFTNKNLTAQEALEWGLINRTVPDNQLLAEAKSLAKIFSTGSSGSNSAIKKLLLQTFSNGLETQMGLESHLISECAGSKDGIEGVKAFIEKREPNFE
jgi:2-(1,2-epoxy-1,2-dihydrophenyl)acetyl-CoA isomerase